MAFTLVGVVAALVMQSAYRGMNVLAANDTWAYWIVNPSDPYGTAVSGERGVFLYSPAIAQLMAPLGLLPWEVVRDGWALGQVALLSILAGPFTGPLVLTRQVHVELLLGNISLILAAVSVAGLRWPALWSFGILTKLTPGIGLLWFVARREWRNLGIALGVTAAIVAVSFAYAPQAWFDWVGTLVANRVVTPEPGFWVPPWPVRVALSAALIWVGAKRNWRWVVPLAVMFSTAHMWPYTVTVAVGSLWYVWTLGARAPRRGVIVDVGVVLPVPPQHGERAVVV